jgi:hypothetical protein
MTMTSTMTSTSPHRRLLPSSRSTLPTTRPPPPVPPWSR